MKESIDTKAYLQKLKAKDESLINNLYDHLDLLFQTSKEYFEHVGKLDFEINPVNPYFFLPFKIESLELSVDSTYSYFIEGLLINYRLLVLGIIEDKLIHIYHEHEEMKHPTTKKNFLATIAKDPYTTKLFILYLFCYYVESSLRHAMFTDYSDDFKLSNVGIDFEFLTSNNVRTVSIMQINFETIGDAKIETKDYLWMVNPYELDDYQMNLLIELLMVNNKIRKILQGAESQDLPYVYDIMLSGNHDLVYEFSSMLFDTKLMCEYQRTLNKDPLDKVRCSIYEAEKYFGVITEQKFEDLEKNYASMGSPSDIAWDIRKINKGQITYALNDVLCLPRYGEVLFDLLYSQRPELSTTYFYIFEVIRFGFMEARNQSNIKIYCKSDTDIINNYLIMHKGSNVTLQSIYISVITDMVIRLDENGKLINNEYIKEADFIDINIISGISATKNMLVSIYKYIIYNNVATNFQVLVKRGQVFKNILSKENLFDLIKKYRYDSLLQLCKYVDERSRYLILTKYK